MGLAQPHSPWGEGQGSVEEEGRERGVGRSGGGGLGELGLTGRC